MDKGDLLAFIYFDFQKAFDKGPNQRRLTKLREPWDKRIGPIMD